MMVATRTEFTAHYGTMRLDLSSYMDAPLDIVNALPPHMRDEVKRLRRQPRETKLAAIRETVDRERHEMPTREELLMTDMRLGINVEYDDMPRAYTTNNFQHAYWDKDEQTMKRVSRSRSVRVVSESNVRGLESGDRQADGRNRYLQGGGVVTDQELTKARYGRYTLMGDIKRVLRRVGIGEAALEQLLREEDKPWKGIIAQHGELIVREADGPYAAMTLEDAVGVYFGLGRKIVKLEALRATQPDSPVKPVEKRQRGNK